MEILIISIVTFFAAILTFFSGFGLGTILTPLMMVFFPVEVAVAFTGVIHFSNNIFKLFLVGNYVNKEVFIKFGIPAIIAAFIGSLVTKIFPLFFLAHWRIFFFGSHPFGDAILNSKLN